jgi:site-specific DNA recombinase
MKKIPDERTSSIDVRRRRVCAGKRQLQARSPKVVAPRVTTGPILLTGLAVCAACGSGMMLRTGTSKNRRVYRYYTCSSCATKGKTVCKWRSIPMEKLDRLVTDHLRNGFLSRNA